MCGVAPSPRIVKLLSQYCRGMLDEWFYQPNYDIVSFKADHGDANRWTDVIIVAVESME